MARTKATTTTKSEGRGEGRGGTVEGEKLEMGHKQTQGFLENVGLFSEAAYCNVSYKLRRYSLSQTRRMSFPYPAIHPVWLVYTLNCLILFLLLPL